MVKNGISNYYFETTLYFQHIIFCTFYAHKMGEWILPLNKFYLFVKHIAKPSFAASVFTANALGADKWLRWQATHHRHPSLLFPQDSPNPKFYS